MRFLAYGWVDELFVKPTFFFTYWGFGWVRPLSASGMHALFVGARRARRVLRGGPLLSRRRRSCSSSSSPTCSSRRDELAESLLPRQPAAPPLVGDAARSRVLARRAPPPEDAGSTRSLRGARICCASRWASSTCTRASRRLTTDWLLHAAAPQHLALGAHGHAACIGAIFDERWAAYAFSWAGFLFDTHHRRVPPLEAHAPVRLSSWSSSSTR